MVVVCFYLLTFINNGYCSMDGHKINIYYSVKLSKIYKALRKITLTPQFFVNYVVKDLL